MEHCVSCNRTFRSKVSLEQHQNTSSKHGGPLRCEACNRSFRSQQALEQHLGDSPAHKRLLKSVLTAPNVPASPSDHNLLQIPVQDGRGSSSFMNQRVHHSTSDIMRDTHSTRDVPTINPGDQFDYQNAPAQEAQKARLKTATAPGSKITRSFYVFPELHQSIVDTVVPGMNSIWFNSNIDDEGFENEHVTCIRGQFTCNHQACRKRTWGSAVVTTLIRGYAHNGYNVVVFNQRCKACNRLGILKLNKETYIERVAYRLKKWAGVMVAMPPPPVQVRNGAEHEQQFCEGCKKGICQRKIQF